MKFTETKLKGAYIIDIEKRSDDRGFFARTWSLEEFAKTGLNTNLVQQNMSLTLKRGTLRGMHFQKAPYSETKIIRVTQGAIYDVIIDLRKESQTYRRWIGIKLTSDNYKMLYVPEGFAHGFVTLANNCEVSYLVTALYSPKFERGVRFDDPAFKIKWPVEIKYISEKDASFPNYKSSFRA